ncbi:MAG: hypothetical protein WB780_24590 [Candidatus Acidiferrales bacterium]
MRAFSKLTVTIALSLLAATGPTAFAQMGHGGPPQMHGVWSPVVGHGAAYEIQSADGKNSTMEITVVGKETVDGKDAYWLEMAMASEDSGHAMLMKHLMVLDGQQTRVVRIIMQMPGRPPMEMPAQMAQRNASHPADIRSDAQDLGSESVTVPAGTFSAEHYRMKDGGDAWVTKDVSPWGMAKFQSKDTTMVLTKVITDAKDKITGTPQPFDLSHMGGRPQQ